MFELEVIIFKQNYNTCLYFQEYNKGFAFSTKFHYFSDQKWHILDLKKKFKGQNSLLGFQNTTLQKNSKRFQKKFHNFFSNV